MNISFYSMLIALFMPKTFYGYATTQEALKGNKIFFRNDLFEEDMIVFKLIHVIYFSDNLKIWFMLIMGHLCVMNDPMELKGKARNI